MPRKGEHQPRRTCIVSREERPREELLRFVLSPEGEVVFDLKGNLPGRGAWLLPRREVVEQAVRARAFNRDFRVQAKASAGLPDLVAERLKEAALATLSLARKAGEAVAGFEKVREAIRAGEAAVIVEAVDGARDGREKILRLARAVSPQAVVVNVFDGGELGLAFGRERVIHAAMKPGGLARKFLKLARKLEGFAEAGAGWRILPAEKWTGTDDE